MLLPHSVPRIRSRALQRLSDGLTTTASVLAEKLRPQTGFPDDEYFSAVGREYDRVIAAAGQLED